MTTWRVRIWHPLRHRSAVTDTLALGAQSRGGRTSPERGDDDVAVHTPRRASSSGHDDEDRLVTHRRTGVTAKPDGSSFAPEGRRRWRTTAVSSSSSGKETAS